MVRRVPQFLLAAQGAGVVGQLLDQLGGGILDVLAAAFAGVAEKGEDAIALGQPAVLVDDFGRRLGRQRAFAVEPRQPPDQACVQRGDAHGVADTRAQVADAQLNGGKAHGRADVPPQLASVTDQLHSLVVGHELVEFRPGPQRTRKAGARQRPDDVQPVGLETGLAAGVERRRRGDGVQQGQVAPHGGHHPDPRISVTEPGMDMHAAHEQPPRAFLKRVCHPFVPFLGRAHL